MRKREVHPPGGVDRKMATLGGTFRQEDRRGFRTAASATWRSEAGGEFAEALREMRTTEETAEAEEGNPSSIT